MNTNQFCLCIALIAAGYSISSAGLVASKTEAQAVDYLSRFGYLAPLDPRLGRMRSAKELKEAVKSFQRFAGLKETGDLTDPKTIEMIQTSRCGLNDFGPTDKTRRKRRYALQGTQWKKNELTFRIENLTPDLYWKDARATLIAALNMWSKETELRFTETRDHNADIRIKFTSGYHGDGYPFDGKGGTLAHAFYPHDNKGISGDAHFDDDETFTIRKHDGVNLYWVAVHEFGHSLGLGHSSNGKSIMFPFYRGYKPDMKLHEDDIRGIRQLYGNRRDREAERATSTPRLTDPPIKPGIPNKCYTGVDAMVHTKDYTYAFKGEYFWPISESGAWTRELKISKFWSGLEGNIDAAVTLSDGKTLIFKGSKYWEFRDRSMYKRAQPITNKNLNLPEELHSMDAAFVWGGNGRLYFFKGDKYWRYNDRLKRIDHGYPRPIRGAWNGVPDNLDAAMQWKNGKSYFFKGIRYYGLDDHTLTVPSIYPRRISTYWMSCSAKGLINSKLAPIKQGNDTSQVPTTDSSSNASPPSGTSTKSHSAASGVSFSVTLLLICFVVHRFSLYDF